MRKKVIIILIFFGILIVLLFAFQIFFLKNTNFKTYDQVELQKTACNTDEDCVFPEIGICVNKNWRDSEKPLFFSPCGFACNGPEFIAGGKRVPKNNCECVNNRCQTINLTNYPGCYRGCD